MQMTIDATATRSLKALDHEAKPYAAAPDGLQILPRNAAGYVIQCAWCLAVRDERGEFTLPSPALLHLPRTSHGVCNACSTTLLTQTAL